MSHYRTLGRAWKRALFAFVLTLSFSAVGQAQDLGIDGAFSPPQAADEVMDGQQAQALTQDYSSTSVDLRIVLPEVTATERADWTLREHTGPLQIGFGREIPAAYQGDLAPRLTWTTLSNGTLVSALSVTSPGARALRVAVYATLEPGAELRFFSLADSAQGFDPLTEQDFMPWASELSTADDSLLQDAPVWSPVIEGETVGIEITLPSSEALSIFSLYIDQVSHIVASIPQFEPQRLSEIDNAECPHIDVQCRAVDPQASATAKMIFNKGSDIFACTGTLLSDSERSFRPYFLTAHHCISTQAVARTLVTYWDFERSPCSGPDPERVTQLSGGADLLKRDPRSDSALLELRRSPPGGSRWYAGWDPAPLGPHTGVYGVHHPAGDLKKYSGGGTPSKPNVSFELEGGQQVDGIVVSWLEGTIEEGSSGSGLFDMDGRLRGVASGAPAGETCPTTAGYGRFDRFFPLIRTHLGSDDGTPDGDTPDDEPPGTQPPDDDQGNTREQAASVKPGSSTPASLGQGDADYFKVRVSKAGTLTVETMGSTDTVGHLEGSDGQLLSQDDDQGLGLNFRLVQSVSAGTYYVRVSGFESTSSESATGPYTLVVSFTPTPTDDSGNTRHQARGVKLNSSTPGALERQGDVDYFQVLVAEAGTLIVETTGGTDTLGALLGADAQGLGQDDDQGLGLNFRLVQQVSVGTYYIQVSGFDGATGPYTLAVRFTPTQESGGGLSD